MLIGPSGRRQIRRFLRALPRKKTVARMTIEAALGEILPQIPPGTVIDIGASHAPYRNWIPHKKHIAMDTVASDSTNILGDIHKLPIRAAAADNVLATEVLEHCHSPHDAVEEIRRILRPGGFCVLTTRFIHQYHPDPHDYFRFTNDGLAHLFREFSEVTIRPLGNAFHSIWLLIVNSSRIPFLSFLNPLVARVQVRRTFFPCGYMVVARR